MDYTRTLAISAAGMTAERTRVEVAATNLANANTVAGPDGSVFQPQRVVTHSVPLGALQHGSFAQQLRQTAGRSAGEALVPSASITAAAVNPRLVLDPGHPLANAAGFVAQPGVDAAQEMMGILSAMRAYEANVAAASATRTLALKALDIGGGA